MCWFDEEEIQCLNSNEGIKVDHFTIRHIFISPLSRLENTKVQKVNHRFSRKFVKITCNGDFPTQKKIGLQHCIAPLC